MSTLKKAQDKSAKKSSKQKWREIEAIRDRYDLAKELQEDDYCWELDMEELGI